MSKKNKLPGEEAFDQYYHALYGERWPALKAALCSNKKSVALANPFHPNAPDLLAQQGATAHSQLPLIWQKPESFTSPGDIADQGTLLPYYLMDEASVWAARALDLRPGMALLDACAAPGGKSLANLFWAMGDIELTVSDLSRERLERMRRIFSQYLPTHILSKVSFVARDARDWYAPPGHLHEGKWPRVLLDAPCSSERHVLESSSHLQEWGEGRTKRLAKDQFSMLCALWSCLAPGGQLIYSTCSISALENQKILQHFFEKRSAGENLPLHELLPLEERFEHLEYGMIALPDRAGFGPIYMAGIKKAP